MKTSKNTGKRFIGRPRARLAGLLAGAACLAMPAVASSAFLQPYGGSGGTIGSNIATAKPVMLSTTAHPGYGAGLLNDGTKGPGAPSAATQAASNQWLLFDLGATVDLGSIVIYNGTSPQNLANVVVEVSATNGGWVDASMAATHWGATTGALSGPAYIGAFPAGTQGRFVRVTQFNNLPLVLSEVEIYGTVDDTAKGGGGKNGSTSTTDSDGGGKGGKKGGGTSTTTEGDWYDAGTIQLPQ